MKPLFVTGIGTGVGKTLIAAIITEKLQADYWKPVQSGDADNSDTLRVRQLVTNPKSRFHPERYVLTQPFSPHKSAALDQVQIRLSDFSLPETTGNRLVIEGAGGLMVPLNDEEMMIDLAARLDTEVILVSMNYLGSINHTLLSAELLKTRGMKVKGIIFNGIADTYSEDVILKYTGLDCLGRIPFVDEPDLAALGKQLDLK